MVRRGASCRLAVVLLGLWLTGTVPAWGQHWVQTRSWDADIQSVQPVGGREGGYILAAGERLFVIDGPQGGWRLRETFLAPMTPVGGVALADVTGSGQPNLVVGGGGAGAAYVYRRGQGGWALVGRTGYLWNPVASVATAEVTAPGRHDVLVTGADGRAHLFHWAFGEFQLRWQSPPDGAVSVLTADLTGDGRAEVIAWRQEGHVGVWQWREGALELVWENYPWGLITALTTGDVDGDGRADIVLTTSQGLLYAFGWQGGEFRLKQHLNLPSTPFTGLAVQGAPPGDGGSGGAGGRAGMQEVDVLATDGVRLYGYRLLSQRLVPTWRSGPVGEVRGLFPVAEGDGFLLWTDRGLRLLERVSEGFLHFRWRGEPQSLRFPPLVEEGVVWLSARDVTERLGWTLYWDPQARRLRAGRMGEFLIADVDSQRVLTHRGPAYLRAPVRLEAGRVYLPYDVLTALGRTVSWNEWTRQLIVD